MPPRRRSRRRFPVGLVAAGLLAALALFLVIGGAGKEGPASASYEASVNQSYAAQVRTSALQSNVTGAQLTALLGSMAGMTRQALQQRLDALVNDSAAQASAVARAVPPVPDPAVDGAVSGALEDRARAVEQVRSAIDGLLGMAPLPVAGAVGSANAPTGAATPLVPASQVTSELQAAGTLVSGSDSAYASARAQLLAGAGHARLVPSRWITNSQLWAPGPLAALVDDLSSSPTLEAQHLVQLTGLRLDPVPVPPPPSTSTSGGGVPPGAQVIPPTTTLGVTALLANNGNVGESGLVVTATLQPASLGSARTVSATTSLQPGTSAAVALPPLSVEAGTEYVLTVTCSTPGGQTNHSVLSTTSSVYIAPATTTTTLRTR